MIFDIAVLDLIREAFCLLLSILIARGIRKFYFSNYEVFKIAMNKDIFKIKKSELYVLLLQV